MYYVKSDVLRCICNHMGNTYKFSNAQQAHNLLYATTSIVWENTNNVL